MVYYTDGRQPPAINTPAGQVLPLSYTPPRAQGAQRPEPNFNNPVGAGIGFGGIVGGVTGGALGLLVGGPPGALAGAGWGIGLGALGGAGFGSALEQYIDPYESPPYGEVPMGVGGIGQKLVGARGGQITTGIYGPSSVPFSWSIENPARSLDGSMIAGQGSGITYKRPIVYPQGRPKIRGGLYNQDFAFFTIDLAGNPVPGGGEPAPNGYQPGRTGTPGDGSPGSPGSPGNPFGLPEESCCERLYDDLADYFPGFGEPGEGLPDPDADPDENPDEPEEGEEENEEDNQGECRGKSPIELIKATIDKIYRLLGGQNFGGDKCNSGSTTYRVNPESYLRGLVDRSYDFSSSGGRVSAINPQEAEVTNIPELIAALIAVVYTREGLWRYPSDLQKSVLNSDLPGLAQSAFQGTTPIPDAGALQSWQFRQLDSLFGEWQQKIVIQDSDLTQEGNQEVTVRLPNLAIGVKELFVLNYQTQSLIQTLVQGMVRSGMELEAIKAETFRSQFLAQAIVDYLGFNTKEVTLDMPTLFNFGGSNQGSSPPQPGQVNDTFADFLKSSSKRINLTEISQTENLQMALIKVGQTLAIVRAALTNKIENTGQFKQQLMEEIKQMAYLLGLNGGENEEGENNRDRFRQDIAEIELGFTNIPDNPDKLNAFGRPLARRPRITEINQAEQESENDNP